MSSHRTTRPCAVCSRRATPCGTCSSRASVVTRRRARSRRWTPIVAQPRPNPWPTSKAAPVALTAKALGSLLWAATVFAAKAAPIEALLASFPSIRRLVFVTGSGSAALFKKHFADWLQRGEFVCGNARADKVFGPAVPPKAVPPKAVPPSMSARASAAGGATQAIELIVAASVSPAAARYDGDFGDKCKSWMSEVFCR